MSASKRDNAPVPAVASAAACGKAIIVGEHFVVWGSTALAIPVHQARLQVDLKAHPRSRNRVILSGEQVDEHTLQAARIGNSQTLTGSRYSLRAQVSSNFPGGAGLGASAAFCVAYVRALQQLPGLDADEDHVAQAAHTMERVFHSHPSGIDSTCIAFDSPCFIKTGDSFSVAGAPTDSGPMAGFLQIAPGAVFIMADTGERRSTRAVVDQVARFMAQPRGEAMFGKFMDVAESIALQTAAALRDGDFEFVGHMLRENHYLLRAMDLSTDACEELIETAAAAGALGAKITGAGLGGFIIALAWPDTAEEIATALRDAGARTVFVQST
jgi:mevalonate kinase